MERHFACTVCGKCCYGWLPLTLDDALARADMFPIGVLWMTVRQGAKSFALLQRLGIALDKKTALRITPFAYIPPSVACPALGADMRCAIHQEKPLRCRTMPFSADREESDQADLLAPRPGWLCDVSANAPCVYRDGQVVDRADFDLERQALEADAPVVKAYGEFLLKHFPAFRGEISTLAKRPGTGQMVVKFSSLLRKVPGSDLTAFAAKQVPVLRSFLNRIDGENGLDAYRRNYADWLAEMTSLLNENGVSA